MNSFDTLDKIIINGKSYNFFNLSKVKWASKLPCSIKVLLENLLRCEDGKVVSKKDIEAFKKWAEKNSNPVDINYHPARVLMQDFTGVPAVVDFAAMKDAVTELGGNPDEINPLCPVDLVIDHSVIVDYHGSSSSFEQNVEKEYERNGERYSFLKWGQEAMTTLRVVPPGTGICHQVNLEYLAKVVMHSEKDNMLFFDTVVGTDSHTTMINGLAVLGWGVGGIEAEANALGQAVSMLIPDVIGVELTGKINPGVTSTDLVLTITEMLRKKGVVGKFVEFYGNALENLTLEDRATIANMAPEYGATCGFFPVDKKTCEYLSFTRNDPNLVNIVEEYAKAQGIWRTDESPTFTETLHLDISKIEPCMAGPSRPQDRVTLKNVRNAILQSDFNIKSTSVKGKDYKLQDGSIVIAAITSCTNTSNPAVMVGAGLIAKRAVQLGLSVPEWVKTSLAPGSQVVSDYLEKADLQRYLDNLGFNIVGFGCTTCIGNSGPMEEGLDDAIKAGNLNVCAVLSGNRNFEGRIHPNVKSSFLASPMLVVIYALAGTTLIDIEKDPIGIGKEGFPIFFKDLWPTNEEISDEVRRCLSADTFSKRYANVFSGDKKWKSIASFPSETYKWEENSTYVTPPPYFHNMNKNPNKVENIQGAKLLALLGDSITTDHISPAGVIQENSPAGSYLKSKGVTKEDFNSYGSRRGNHEIMMRGTFANVRLSNELVPGINGGYTLDQNGNQAFIFDAAMEYKSANTPLIVIAGKEYGTGSSRDWAAKGTNLLGVKAVIAESFERIHRSNLVGMGVLPLCFKDGVTRKDFNLNETVKFNILGLENQPLKPRMELILEMLFSNGSKMIPPLLCRLDTEMEIDYFVNGGILPYVLRQKML